MIGLILVVPLAAFLWSGALLWIRYLNTRDLLAGVHPTAADVADIEAGLPKMPGDHR